MTITAGSDRVAEPDPDSVGARADEILTAIRNGSEHERLERSTGRSAADRRRCCPACGWTTPAYVPVELITYAVADHRHYACALATGVGLRTRLSRWARRHLVLAMTLAVMPVLAALGREPVTPHHVALWVVAASWVLVDLAVVVRRGHRGRRLVAQLARRHPAPSEADSSLLRQNPAPRPDAR